MEAARVARTPSLTGALQYGIVTVLFVLAAIAWIATDARMGGMDAGPGTDLGSFGFFIGLWVVMMAAMMFPSVWPMVLTFRRVQDNKREQGKAVVAGGTALIVAGYLLSWALAGAAAYGLVALVDSLAIDALAWDEAGPYVAGGVIFAAAIYQLTPLKDVCLRYCRNPITQLMHHWHPGPVGALRMGLEHGAWCVGCCWMLMAALFALGAMSLGWMALIAGLIAIEKLLPWRATANRGIALLLAVVAIGVAFAPEDVPGLTIPGSTEAMSGMDGMQMDGTKSDAMKIGP